MLGPSEGRGVRHSGYGLSSHRHTGVLAFWLPQPDSAWEHPAPFAGAQEEHCPHSAWEHPTPSASAEHCPHSVWKPPHPPRAQGRYTVPTQRKSAPAGAGLCV